MVRVLQAYERGIALFRWPNVYDIWNTYLTKFIDRYGGKKLERARDLFEQALDGCPAKYAKSETENTNCFYSVKLDNKCLFGA